jgi:putative membrane protein
MSEVNAPGAVPKAQSPKSKAPSDRAFYLFNAVVSAAALSLLFWLLVIRKPTPGTSPILDFLPMLNALLNSTSAVLLILGRGAIKRGDRKRHAQLMLGAFAASVVFLISYLAYHFMHGETHYLGSPTIRAFYLLVLASHVLLSIAVVPLLLAALWFAAKEQFGRHKRVTRWLYPIWVYVSITGVIVYLMLYQLPHGTAA